MYAAIFAARSVDWLQRPLDLPGRLHPPWLMTDLVHRPAVHLGLLSDGQRPAVGPAAYAAQLAEGAAQARGGRQSQSGVMHSTQARAPVIRLGRRLRRRKPAQVMIHTRALEGRLPCRPGLCLPVRLHTAKASRRHQARRPQESAALASRRAIRALDRLGSPTPVRCARRGGASSALLCSRHFCRTPRRIRTAQRAYVSIDKQVSFGGGAPCSESRRESGRPRSE